MKTVVILGAGNVAFHLTRALLENTIQVKQIYNRTLAKAEEIGEAHKIRYTDKISEIEKADVYIICASDASISEISYHIPFEDVLVVHTSGSMSINELKGKYRKGVLYPLQTFSKKKSMEYDNVPFFIEAENPTDEESLKKLINRVSEEVHIINSEQRLRLHLCAVLVSNFVNHLYTLGKQLCEENKLDFDILRPLIYETTEKVMRLSPEEAQTGPAKRRDQEVIDKHINLIKDDKLQLIYKLMSDSIIKTYHG